MTNNIEMRKIIYGTEDYEKSIDIRNEEFRKPQGLDIRDEDLSGDKDMDMYGGYIGDELMSLVFLTEANENTGQAKSVIVTNGYKGKGIGKYLMNFIEEKAREKGYEKMKVMGRVSVEGFYEKLGYKPTSEPFDYFQTPHLYMEKQL